MLKLSRFLLINVLFLNGLCLCYAQEKSEMALTVSPAFKWLTEGAPYGDLRITNEGTVSSEVTIRATGLGDASRIGDLSTHLVVFPPRLILSPGETRILRYAVMDMAPIQDGGHTALIKARMVRRAPVDQGQIPAASAALRINYEMVVPIILIKGMGEPEVKATIKSYEEDQLVLDMTNQGNSPWSGIVHIESENGESILGSIGVTIFEERQVEIELIAPLPNPFRVSFEESWTPERRLRTPDPILFTR